MKHFAKYIFVVFTALLVWSCGGRKTIALEYPEDGSSRMKFAAEHITGVLEGKGYDVVSPADAKEGVKIIRRSEVTDSVGPKEGFHLTSADNI